MGASDMEQRETGLRAWSARVRRTLEQGVPSPPGAPSLDSQTIVVLVASIVLLVLLWYYGRLPFFREVIAPRFLAGAERSVSELWGYYYLAASSIVTRMLLPLAIIVFVFRKRPRDFGYRLSGTRGLLFVYLGLLAFMLPVLIYASSLKSFQTRYPLYDWAHESLALFLVYELSYVLVFLSGESFWRGFMVFGMAPKFGLYSVFIMAIPYSMIHFGKPFPEAMGAILTGVVLGVLALKHRSFWLGIALHSTIGFTMDVLCLWRKGQLWALFGL